MTEPPNNPNKHRLLDRFQAGRNVNGVRKVALMLAESYRVPTAWDRLVSRFWRMMGGKP